MVGVVIVSRLRETFSPKRFLPIIAIVGDCAGSRPIVVVIVIELSVIREIVVLVILILIVGMMMVSRNVAVLMGQWRGTRAMGK